MEAVSKQLERFAPDFEDGGFMIAVMLLNANQYGLPQASKRLYFAAIPVDHL